MAPASAALHLSLPLTRHKGSPCKMLMDDPPQNPLSDPCDVAVRPGTRDHAEYYWRITKDENQRSFISQEDILE